MQKGAEPERPRIAAMPGIRQIYRAIWAVLTAEIIPLCQMD